jgi:hypothetical protein
MAITCNFDKDDYEEKKCDKVIVRIDPGQDIGEDSPCLKPVKNSAYLWVVNPRRRSCKTWRAPASIN